MTSKHSALRYAYEQCTPATEQWKRLLSSVGPPKGHIRRALIDPSVARLVNSVDDDYLQCSLFAVNNSSTVCDSSSSRHCLFGEDSDGNEASCSDGLTPWKAEQKCYSSGLNGLNEEIEDFVQYMRPVHGEEMMRKHVIHRISCLVTELWPSAKVEVFGSTATGLFLPTSDIDLVVCWDLDSQPEVMQSALLALEKQIINKGIYDDVKVLKTSVPIVKFTDRETAIKVDVGFKTTISTGPQSVLFIKEKMKEYPQLEFLVLVLKQFLVYHNLLESFNGGISSYCLILLIISYLQMSGSEDDLNHGRDLIQFLELYGCQFNYLRTGIRITDGGSYFRKNDGLAGHADNSYQQYSLLCIEDPLKSENDVGRGCYGAMKVRDAFANAFRELRDAVLPQYEDIQPCGSSILGRILRIPPHIVKYRRIICRRSMAYDTSPLSPLIASMEDCRLIPVTDDRSDSGSCSSQISNLSSRTKSSTSQSMTGSQSSGSGAISDNESDGNSDTSKPNLHDLPQLLTAAVSYSTPADTTAGHTSTVTTTGHIVVTIPSTVVSTGIVTPVPSQVFTARSLQSDLNLTTTVTAVHSSVSSPSNSSVHIYHNRNPRHPVAMTSTTSRNANAERRSRKPGPGSSQSSTDNSSVSANR